MPSTEEYSNKSYEEYLEFAKEFVNEPSDRLKPLMAGLSFFNAANLEDNCEMISSSENEFYFNGYPLWRATSIEMKYLLSIGWRWNQNRYCWVFTL